MHASRRIRSNAHKGGMTLVGPGMGVNGERPRGQERCPKSRVGRNQEAETHLLCMSRSSSSLTLCTRNL